jgi:hypothetical protein
LPRLFPIDTSFGESKNVVLTGNSVFGVMVLRSYLPCRFRGY